MGDIITHGIDVVTDGPDSVRILAVDHDRLADSFLIFSYELGTDTIELIIEVVHPNIRTANSVSQYNSTASFITNDHYFPKGLGRSRLKRFIKS